MRTEKVDELPEVVVAPGVVRRGLIATDFVRGWIIDFAPGSEWPQIDVHEGEERYFVLSGEIIEGDLRYTAGTHVVCSTMGRAIVPARMSDVGSSG